MPRYQFTASGLYQLPWGVNLAGNMVARQGFGLPFFETVESNDASAPEKRVLLVDPDDRGCPACSRSTCGSARRSRSAARELALDLDMFNLMNSATVLGRQYDVTATGSTGFNQALEIMNPRLVRLGVRFQF